MSFDFNSDEIFEMAEQIEINGAKFYRSASEDVSNHSFKKLLKDLALMEDEHKSIFSSMRSKLTEKEKEQTTFDPQSESTLYLKALADGRVAFKRLPPDTKVSKEKSEKQVMKEILKYAIGIEKDSIAFYLGMKDLVPENLGKEKIEGIIKEEMKHIRILSNEFNTL